MSAFEQAVAAKVGARHAVAVNSATSALHIACLALGLGPGDLLWTSPITFVASANCGRYCGADVDFVDIDPETGLMSVTALATKLKMLSSKASFQKSWFQCISVELAVICHQYQNLQTATAFQY